MGTTFFLLLRHFNSVWCIRLGLNARGWRDYKSQGTLPRLSIYEPLSFAPPLRMWQNSALESTRINFRIYDDRKLVACVKIPAPQRVNVGTSGKLWIFLDVHRHQNQRLDVTFEPREQCQVVNILVVAACWHTWYDTCLICFGSLLTTQTLFVSRLPETPAGESRPHHFRFAPEILTRTCQRRRWYLGKNYAPTWSEQAVHSLIIHL